jgi:hypothetical protein
MQITGEAQTVFPERLFLKIFRVLLEPVIKDQHLGSHQVEVGNRGGGKTREQAKAPDEKASAEKTAVHGKNAEGIGHKKLM